MDFPTRITDRIDQRSSLLDIFLTSNPDICNIAHESPLGKSDHIVVSVNLTLNCPTAQESPIHRTLFSYDSGDWDNFRDLLRDAED